jgi:purine-binding chemotaxis protein CheW
MADYKSKQSESTEKKGNVIRQLVCFRLGDEEYGLDIQKVHEINRLVNITKIPQAPVFVEGVINLRGKIIPIIDLRKRFGFEALKVRDKENRIIVIEAHGSTVGMIVDAVTEVLRLQESQIEATPDLATASVDVKYIDGVAMLEQRLLIVLNSDLIFSDEEIKKLEAVK